MKNTQHKSERRKKNIILCCLAVMAVFVTAYFLMLPAITLEAVNCGIDEHTHSYECYEYIPVTALSVDELTQNDELICTEGEGDGHMHCEECIGEDGVYVCGEDEYEGHTHDISCYNEKVLICEYEEHIHTSECSELITDAVEEDILTTEENDAGSNALLLPSESVNNLLLMTNEPEPLNLHDASAMDSDLNTVSGEGITFKLFNYSLDINKTSDKSAWRDISEYFTFRNSSMSTGIAPSAEIHIPSPNTNADHDVDGFPAKHATVRRVLDESGYPVLDLTRNADGTSRVDPGVDDSILSLAYLFSDMGDHAVTAYSPANTVLQKNGTHYWYNSMDNAVDYDIENGIFRVRNYAERNSTTAANSKTVENADGSSSVRPYGDFIPFTYTGGETSGTNETTGYEYHVASTDTDYWFGMSMEVEFFQTKDGIVLNEETGLEEEMVFSFSGDDDVWVFVDDVLVLDLGGTHGTVDGSVNFANGEILQYLSWNDANSTDEAKTGGSATSFPTSIRECFDAAGRTPSGGWSESGKTFADYTKHTLKFFYLERGSAVANCHLDFRLPTLPDKSLTVSKDLIKDSSTIHEGAVEDFIENSLSYKFRVVKADESGNATDELFILPGTAYDIMQSGVSIGGGAVDSDGYFSLKAGQSAQFTEMLNKGNGHTDYIVQEVLPNGLTGQYGGVEYSVSSDTGSTLTEGEEKEDFTYFDTKVLSAQQSQTVVYRNKVDISELCTLKITKQQAQGSQFSPEAVFRIKVRLGDELLPEETGYTINGTAYKVAEEGIIELKVGETAVIEGILSGTHFDITELGSEDGNFNASYTGEASSEDCKINVSSNGVVGEFVLNSTIGVTVTNASYDFAARIPISKLCIDNDTDASFSFDVVELIKDGESFMEGDSLPGTIITVTDDSTTVGKILIGYGDGTSGTFFYRISEAKSDGDYIFDNTFYIVQTDVNGKDAVISHIWKNGTEEISPTDTLSFVNRKTTSLTVRKKVISDGTDVLFPFSATVMLNGEAFTMPEPQGEDYTVTGNVISFSLSGGGVICIPNIPYNAVVTVKETSHDGFIPYYRVEGIDTEPVGGDSVDIHFASDAMAVEFTNKMSYSLPETGGRGTEWFTLGGMLIMTAVLLWYKREYRNICDTRKNEGNTFRQK